MGKKKLDLPSLFFSSSKKLQNHHKSSSSLINLMVMDYGPPNKYVCVIDPLTNLCDMGKSAVAAA